METNTRSERINPFIIVEVEYKDVLCKARRAWAMQGVIQLP